jgi:sigma-B regulation protein RsbU (phosphoserine phosphatase)
MHKRSIFQFKSITHRLIFSCVVSAIAIYGASYWQARQIIQRIVGGWMLDLAQSQIDLVVKEIDGKLLEIERDSLLLLPIIREVTAEPHFDFDRELAPLLDTLIEDKSLFKSIAFLKKSEKETINIEWEYGQKLNSQENEQKKIFAGCSISSKNIESNRPFWTEPYLLNKQLSSWGISYCVPVSSFFSKTKQPNLKSQDLLAISIGLDWLSPLIKTNAIDSRSVNYLKSGDPFLFSNSNREWIIAPNNPQLIRSWLEEEKTLATHRQDTLIKANISDTDLVLGIVFPSAQLKKLERQYLWMAIASMVKDMILMCLVIAFISQRAIRPIRALNSSTQEIAKGNLDINLPIVNSEDEVGRLTQSFRLMRDSLQLHIRNLQETTAAKQKLESELSIAAQIQRTMIPRISIDSQSNSPYEISALLKPARIVGGDLYDFFMLASDRLCLIIGDVADKGFPAALLMARTVTLIRTLTLPWSTPSEILKVVNRELCAENEECLS